MKDNNNGGIICRWNGIICRFGEFFSALMKWNTESWEHAFRLLPHETEKIPVNARHNNGSVDQLENYSNLCEKISPTKQLAVTIR